MSSLITFLVVTFLAVTFTAVFGFKMGREFERDFPQKKDDGGRK